MQRAPSGPPARSSQQRGPSRRAARGADCPAMEEASGGAVNQLLPDMNLSPRELSQSPKLAKLLLLLTERMDQSGLSLTVKRDLAKTQRELRKQRQEWLRIEALQRILDEMLTEYHAKRWGEGVSSEDQQVRDGGVGHSREGEVEILGGGGNAESVADRAREVGFKVWVIFIYTHPPTTLQIPDPEPQKER
ncbi:uncharacterized protein LOC144490707 [Mustelus asterias]